MEVAIAGGGIIQLFEDWLRPHLDSFALEPVLRDWWQPLSRPFLRAFLDVSKRRPD